MARLPDEIVERIRREISVQRLAEARGIKLRRVGKNLMGLCPFHQEKTPSLSITPSVNKWHCLGCGKGGTAIDWVMCAEGVSTRHALEMLSRDLVPMTSSGGPPPKKSTVPKLPPLIVGPVNQRTNDDKKLLEIVVSYYHKTLKEKPDAQQYLVKRGLQSAEMVEHFRLGYSNRTLGYHMPASNRLAGAEQRGRLTELGIYRESGHEHFSGSLVIPIFNLDGDAVQMYGRKITANLRAGTPDHLYLPGPLRGVWNEQALIASKEIILCEALIDALTFWCAGYRNVTTIYGVNNFTDELRAALKHHGTKRIYIAYDRDDAGARAAQAHGEELMSLGIECFRVQFPKGSVKDANECALKTTPAAKILGILLHSAAWLGKGKRPAVNVPKPLKLEVPHEIEEAKTQTDQEERSAHVKKDIPSPDNQKPAAKEKIASEIPTPSLRAERIFPLAANPESAQPEEAPQEQRPMPLSSPAEPLVKIEGEEITVTIGARTYRVLGLEKNTSRGVMRVNVKVSGRNLRGEYCYHGDTLDMESFRQRAAFTKQAAHELAVKEETIHADVGKLWTKLGDLQREHIKKTLETPQEETIMNAEEQTAALDLLRDPRLLDRVLSDFDKCGVVGEETNKRVSYLAAVSRLLDKPLAIVVQSSSSAGKSSLMEAVLDFMPEEQREEYSAMTGQALFYMGQKNLKHKILAVSEEEGAQRAAYALKLLQSEGVLKIASTGKDPVSGKLVTHEYIVEGPVMIFLTTTAQEVDEELVNRSIVLTVNEEQEQTRAIHQKQREAQTIEGLWARRERQKIVKLHRNAQRLLRPIAVVNNHVHDNPDFPDHMTRTRRDHMKFLTLIETIALLHQHQREIKTDTRDGETLEYIEATKEDVKLARELVRQVLAPSLDELPAHTRRLLVRIETMAQGECERLQVESSEYRFTRRTVRQFTRWGDTQLRLHLRRLEEMEYLMVRRGGPGQTFVYQLRFDYDGNRAGLEGNCAGVNGDCAGGARVLRGGAESEPSAATTRANATTARVSENTYRGIAAADPKNRVIAQSKPNGRAHVAGVK
ncbi:MAG TPA: CHC2 zinc finger domain-containing protein [Candidatus Angelobacter sp.]|nr:CHC2 zinc finger domain-containing protein [Candidatus Angelobacter sp.]